MQTRRRWTIVLGVLATATTAGAIEGRPLVIEAPPAWTSTTAPPTTARRPTTTKADYFVGHQWVLAGGSVSVRERVAVLLEIDLAAGVVRQVVLPEGPDAPAAGPAQTFAITSWTQKGSLLTLRATRPHDPSVHHLTEMTSGGTHMLQLSIQGATSSTHEVWANQHGVETRSIIRTATRVTRFVVDHDADGLDGLARRLDFERRLDR